MGLIASAILGRVWAFARSVPWWVWVVVVALAWGGWQRHQAQAVAATLAHQQAQAAAEREAKLAADLTESNRRTKDLSEIAHHADDIASQARADADGERAAADRLRLRLAAAQANARTAHPTAAGASAPAGDTAGMLADVLGQCVDRVGLLARIADERGVAGTACERSYDALTK